MAECNLLCNVSNCRKEITTLAWVTICSHIFCSEHLPEEVVKKSLHKYKCPACNHPLSNSKYDLILQDLKPNEEYKSMVLAGINPDKVLDICQRALMFWMYQMYQERLYREAAAKTAKQREATLTDYCETVVTKNKFDLQKMNRQVETLQKEIQEKTQKIEDLIVQLAEKSRLTKSIQNKYDCLKRQLASSYITPTKDSDSMSQNFAYESGHAKPTYEELKHYGRNGSTNYDRPLSNSDCSRYGFAEEDKNNSAFDFHPILR